MQNEKTTISAARAAGLMDTVAAGQEWNNYRKMVPGDTGP